MDCIASLGFESQRNCWPFPQRTRGAKCTVRKGNWVLHFRQFRPFHFVTFSVQNSFSSISTLRNTVSPKRLSSVTRGIRISAADCQAPAYFWSQHTVAILGLYMKWKKTLRKCKSTDDLWQEHLKHQINNQIKKTKNKGKTQRGVNKR